MSSNFKTVPLEKIEQGVDDALTTLRTIRDNTPNPRGGANRSGDMLSRPIPRGFNIVNVYKFLSDCFAADATEAELERFPDAIRQYIRSLYKEQTVPDFDSAHLMEETAEAAVDIAEAEFRIHRDSPRLLKLEQAKRQHAVTAELQIRAARRTVFGGNVA